MRLKVRDPRPIAAGIASEKGRAAANPRFLLMY
jgi:hypothetical protein